MVDAMAAKSTFEHANVRLTEENLFGHKGKDHAYGDPDCGHGNRLREQARWMRRYREP